MGIFCLINSVYSRFTSSDTPGNLSLVTNESGFFIFALSAFWSSNAFCNPVATMLAFSSADKLPEAILPCFIISGMSSSSFCACSVSSLAVKCENCDNNFSIGFLSNCQFPSLQRDPTIVYGFLFM